jgi:hypothetical protein
MCVEKGMLSNLSSQQQEVSLSFFLPSNPYVVNSCFFFFIVEEVSGEGSASFYFIFKEAVKGFVLHHYDISG